MDEKGRASLNAVRNAEPTLARLPPLTSLRAFVATARHLNFIRAADELHVTSAAIGQQIRLLESHIGKSLFLRSRGQLQLTETGRALVPGLTDAFDRLLHTIGQLAEGAESGLIRVSVAPSFASKWLVPRLSALREIAPDLEVVVDASPQLADLDNDEIDCVVRYGLGAYPGLKIDRLFPEAVLPVCSPDFAQRHGLYGQPHSILHVPLLHEDGPERDPSCPDWAAWQRTAGISWQTADAGIRLSQSSLVIDAAIAGLGIGLAKLRLAEADLACGRLVSPWGEAQPVEFSYFFATSPRKAKLPRVARFRTWLLEASAAEHAARRAISSAALRPATLAAE